MIKTDTPKLSKGGFIPIIIIGYTLIYFCINTDKFIYPSLQLYFSFTFCVITLASIACIWNLMKKNKIELSLPDLLMAIWGIYIIGHSFFIKPADDYQVIYLLSGILYYYSLIFFFMKQLIRFEQIYLLFAWMGVLQAVVCILQFSGIVNSGDLNYYVKGTFYNPNITAMYVALSMPFFSTKVIHEKRRLLNSVVLVLLFLALIALKCRTAYVGLIIIACIYFIKETQIRKYWDRVTRKLKFVIVFVTILLLCGLFTALYFQKKASADGRVFVWKVSLEMLMQNPIKGCGYGLFEKEYNLAQAHYIKTLPTTVAEKEHARYVYMPYNDLLEHALQGGIIGVLLFALLMSRFVFLAIRSKQIELSAITLAYSIMMLINFAQQAIPVWFLFLTVVAALTAEEKPLFVVANKRLITWGSLSALLAIFAFTFVQMNRKQAQEQLKMAIVEYKSGNHHNAIRMLEANLDNAGTSEVYFRRYGGMLITSRKKQEGCRILERATCYSSAPSLQFDLAFAYLKLGKRDKAMERLILVQNMVPTNKRAKELMRIMNTSPSAPLQK